MGSHANSNTEHLRSKSVQTRCLHPRSSGNMSLLNSADAAVGIPRPRRQQGTQQLLQSHTTVCTSPLISASPVTRLATGRPPGTSSDRRRRRVAIRIPESTQVDPAPVFGGVTHAQQRTDDRSCARGTSMILCDVAG